MFRYQKKKNLEKKQGKRLLIPCFLSKITIENPIDSAYPQRKLEINLASQARQQNLQNTSNVMNTNSNTNGLFFMA